MLLTSSFELMFAAVVPVVLILALAYWFSRYLGKRWGTSVSGHHIKVIDRMQVGTDRHLLLVKIKEKTYLLGMSDKGIQLLAEPEGVFEEPEQEKRNDEFRKILKKAYGSFTERNKHE